VASKNRNSSKRKTQRQGLSGNPQRRAEQLEKDRSARQGRQGRPGLDGIDAGSLRNLAYLLAGGAEEAPWWRGSHERVVQKARALGWPSRLRGVEDQACELVGGQFYDNLEAHDGGHHQAQWARALAESAGAALRAAITGGGDWQPLWALLYGVALTTPEPATADEEAALREEFPGIKDACATAVTELEKAAALLSSSERLAVTPLSLPVSGPRPAGVPLVARDAYGSRFLVAAPFAYEGDTPDHWYAWDVDTCWVVSVVAAGTFDSAGAALAEWRGAVGAAAGDAGLSPGDPGLVARLLDPCLQTGAFANMLQGNEPRELIRELYRMRRRARVLTGAPADEDAGQDSAGGVDQFGQPAGAHKAFQAWHRARHPDAPKGVADSAEMIIGEWGPGRPLDERAFYACSPYRVAMTAHLLDDGYQPAHASQAIRLLPEWAEWCARQSGIPGNLAAPSVAAARRAVDALDQRGADELSDPTDTTPFRHQE
jgi:hypothetical protein